MNAIQGGQPQRLLLSQGMARPGAAQGQHWAWRTWRQQAPGDRLPFVRPTPPRHADARLSNPEPR
jgi:hypothetical protein